MPSKILRKQKMIAAFFTIITISACGGGGGGDNTELPTNPSTPNNPNTPSTPSTLMKFTDGDSYTYSSTGYYLNAPPNYSTQPFTSHYTYTIKNPNADFSHDLITTTAPQSGPSTSRINKNNQTDSFKTKYISCEHTNEKERPGFSPQIGEAWSVDYRRVCNQPGSVVTYEHSSTGNIIQREPYTTEAGTFWAFKTEITSKQISPLSTSINKRTCWHDEISAQTVACEGHTKSTSTSIPDSNYERKYTISLIGINTKNHPVKNSRVERFAGYWDIKIAGTGKDNCLISIEASGKTSGTCSRDGYGFEMEGTVTPEGFIALLSRGSGLGIAGNFADPTTANGTWKTSWENGTWAGIPTNSP